MITYVKRSAFQIPCDSPYEGMAYVCQRFMVNRELQRSTLFLPPPRPLLLFSLHFPRHRESPFSSTLIRFRRFLSFGSISRVVHGKKRPFPHVMIRKKEREGPRRHGTGTIWNVERLLLFFHPRWNERNEPMRKGRRLIRDGEKEEDIRGRGIVGRGGSAEVDLRLGSSVPDCDPN